MKRAEEIERKFLVSDLPDLTNARTEAIRQGYLTSPDDSVEVRIRQIGENYFITRKSGSGLTREEHEAHIDGVAFSRLWPATAARRIEKTRWTAPLSDQWQFELDIFDGALSGLKLVEVEFENASAARAFVPPAWFGREVTEDERFSNASLALHGLVDRHSSPGAA